MSTWFAVRSPLKPKQRSLVTFLSFALPIFIWVVFSYVPILWHPMMEIENKGDVSYFKEGMLVEKDVYWKEHSKTIEEDKAPPVGSPANPIYLPAPHEVIVALYTSFTTEPKRRSEKWLHESIWDSIQVIFWGFVLSSLIGLPLGVLAGTYDFFSKLFEPFIEFFRYLPAPAFGALAVAILGIYQAPKIAIIFIGTFFQQVLVIANTTRKLDPSLIEAAQTLGAKNKSLLFKIVVPGTLPELYRDMRILLGWAWTYLIVSELVGTSSGITWFITQQARYKNFDNVFAAIIIIGIIGLTVDMILAAIAKRLFPWQKKESSV